MTVKRKLYITFSWMLTAACMVMIFYMSAQPADKSSDMSNSLIQQILDFAGIELSSFLIRKAAHTVEFMGLCMLICNAVYATWEIKAAPAIAWLSAAAYAVTDELHQLFSDGRACQLRDVLIDSLGALLGAVICFVIIRIIIERRNKNGDAKAVSGSTSEE